MNFESQVALSYESNFEINIRVAPYDIYPWLDKLYASPKILEHTNTVNTRRSSLTQLFMKNTVNLQPLKEDVYSLGILLLKIMFLLPDDYLSIIKQDLIKSKDSDDVV